MRGESGRRPFAPIALLVALPLGACAAAGTPDPAFDRIATVAQVPAAIDGTIDRADALAVARYGDTATLHVVAETDAGLVERYVTLQLTPWPEGTEKAADIVYSTGSTVDGHESPVTSVTTVDGLQTVSRSAAVQVAVHGPDGEHLASRSVAMNVFAFARSDRPLSADHIHRTAPGLLQLVLSVPELDALLFDVARRPPLWSVILGVRVGCAFDIEGASPIAGSELVAVPATIRANGHDAINGAVDIGRLEWPYLLTGGMRRIEGRHPGRPDRRCIVRVVGTERGVGSPIISTAIGGLPAPDTEGRMSAPLTPLENVDGSARAMSGSVRGGD